MSTEVKSNPDAPEIKMPPGMARALRVEQLLPENVGTRPLPDDLPVAGYREALKDFKESCKAIGITINSPAVALRIFEGLARFNDNLRSNIKSELRNMLNAKSKKWVAGGKFLATTVCMRLVKSGVVDAPSMLGCTSNKLSTSSLRYFVKRHTDRCSGDVLISGNKNQTRRYWPAKLFFESFLIQGIHYAAEKCAAACDALKKEDFDKEKFMESLKKVRAYPVPALAEIAKELEAVVDLDDPALRTAVYRVTRYGALLVGAMIAGWRVAGRMAEYSESMFGHEFKENELRGKCADLEKALAEQKSVVEKIKQDNAKELQKEVEQRRKAEKDGMAMKRKLEAELREFRDLGTLDELKKYRRTCVLLEKRKKRKLAEASASS